MNMLDFKVFQVDKRTAPEQDSVRPQSPQEDQEQSGSGQSIHPKENLEKATRVVSSIDDAANPSRKISGSKRLDTEDANTDHTSPQLLFPNLKLSPLSLGFDMTPPVGSFSRALEQYKRPVGYGGQFVHKYGRFIQTLTVAQPHSLQYLGPHCRNLRELSVYNWCSPELVFQNGRFPSFLEMPNNNLFQNGRFPSFLGIPNNINWDIFRVSKGQRRMLRVWIGVLKRNPHLRVVRFELNLIPVGGLAKFASALSKLKYLEEIEVFDPNVDRRIEVLLDHCPDVPKLTWSFSGHRDKTSIRRRDDASGRQRKAPIHGRSRIRRPLSEKLTSEELGGSRRPTRIQTLDLRDLPRTISELDLRRVLTRMPLLKCLWVPIRHLTRRRLASAMEGVSGVTSEINCPLLTRLEISFNEHSSNMNFQPMDQLLNVCPQLTSLGLYNMQCEFDPGEHFRRTSLRLHNQILEYEERLPSACLITRGHQLYLTMLFPNLRVLDLGTRPVHLNDFFRMGWHCKDTLVQLTLSLCCDQSDAQAYKRTITSTSGALVSNEVLPESSATQPIRNDDRGVLQTRIFESLLPLARLEKLRLPKGLWNEKTTSFPFVINTEAIIQIRKLRRLTELVVHSVQYPLH
ncbi:hypothetical protein EMPS_08889 [Entomortierella parvispora]|uniref:Uncharacterized protein n=1 Tax=Entomortierella parvispora TaxID=205924 RepID=A0A9P3HGX8_9FUNG|nr:hypothetical protein EMPS_08889 [Entomortierella parvispora]